VIGIRIAFTVRDYRLRWVAAGIIACHVAMIFGAFSNNYFAYLPLNIFYWFSLGVLMRLPTLDEAAANDAWHAPPRATTASGALAPSALGGGD
jgi:hypothetical protein